ncbi:Phophatidylinositol-4-phosphate 5-kinase [Caballeronia glathei]|jgi:antitoxin component YwqK of YwqJK toxin-antitoxin module|uniref:toxin-antitoxin system YwqK family antitoxin n=1 Tax=Caballeronia glathei TaxID=60547 RepID=UPI00050781C3|nr:MULTISPECIES: hypothetical protein [Burkholderiaceae]TCK36208.1 MORN repeat protein [Paraburkholderia sp. BL8N3]CDY79612.1 Phophatidylinositol-4-phosphate 5-kinase [Caballeronia glathei]
MTKVRERLQDVSIERGDSRIEGTTLDGALHGTARVQVDGVIVAEQRYARGALHGPATLMHPDGSVAARLNYADDKLDGKAVYFLPDGRIQREAHYARGLLHGPCKTWLPDGTLLEHAIYRQGKLQGVQLRFHPNSRLAERQVFNSGKPIEPAERYARDGRPLGADGKPLSRWRNWWRAVLGPPGASG